MHRKKLYLLFYSGDRTRDEDSIKVHVSEILCEVDKAGSRSCPVAPFGIYGVEPRDVSTVLRT
jgi:hypothetical protein